MEKKIIFTNLNEGPMTMVAPEWQRDIMEKVSKEYSDRALEVSEMIRKEFEARLEKTAPGHYATAFAGVLKRVPRYAFIKNVEDSWGHLHDVQIDLALHTVEFIEVE